MNKKIETINIDEIVFEDDPEVIGKWQIIGEYDTKEYFLSQSDPNKSMYGENFKEIYFLPGGQRYWIYGWTKGSIIFKNGDYTAVNPYQIEEINGEKYMFVDWKSYSYIKFGGQTTVLVLKQADDKKYNIMEISKIDDVDKPFVDDKKILGKWKAVAYIRNKDDYFHPDYPQNRLFFKFTECKENGWCANIFGDENRIHTSPYVTWTKGYMLYKSSNIFENVAAKYEIKTIDGVEYLFIEWKSGDYIWGGWDPTYYVFVRE